MPRVNTKKKSSAGKPYDCNKCDKKIRAGQEYFEWTFYKSSPNRRHVACGHPRPSELTNSKIGTAYGAIEALQDTIDAARKAKSLDGVMDAVDEAISELEGVRDEYQDSIDSMGDNLAQGDVGQQCQEKIDELENYISNLESAKDEIESAESGITDEIAEEPEGTEPGDSEDSQPHQDVIVDQALDALESTVGDYGF